MTAISSDYQVDWYRVSLSKEQLQELNSRSNFWGLMQAGGYLLTVASSAGLCIWLAVTQQWWWLLPALFLHGTVSGFHINAVHELVHGTVFRWRWLNELFVHIFAFLGWVNHRGFWASHAEHHLYTLHDPHDQEETVPIRYTLGGFLSTFVNPFALLRTVQDKLKVAMGRNLGPWMQHLLEGQERRHAVYAWSRIMISGHVIIAAVSIYYGLWIIPVVVSCTPAYGRTLLFLLNNTQHVGMQDHVTDFRLNCRTMKVNPVFRFLYWHMNWHIEHHMYAGVPCYRLHALHKLIKHELPPTTSGLLKTWFEIIYILYRQEREPGWQFQPQLPGQPAEQVPAKKSSTSTEPASPVAAVATERRKVWQCTVCAFIYDEALGLPEEGIPPGTAWEDIPEDWHCPDCGVAKADFHMVEISRPVVGVVDEGAVATASSALSVDVQVDPIVIVGSGLAGYTLAKEYRKLDRQQEILLLTEDDGAFYAKPALSNALAEERSPDQLVQKTAVQMAEEFDLRIRCGLSIGEIDRADKRLVVRPVDGGGDDETISYSQLVLAQGADPINVPISGDAADQVLRVNRLADYRRFRQALSAKSRVAILGGGLIGCEFANDLAGQGHAVHVLDLATEPLGVLVPEAIGASLRTALAGLDVRWHGEDSIVAVDRAEDGLRCRLQSGASITVDLVLSAVGLRPRSAQAAASGLAVGRGIQVDAELRSSDPAIFALGDCAEVDGRVRPYVLPIMHAAKALARTLAGDPTAVDWPCMPVVVKTPALPILLVSPEPGAEGRWTVDERPDGLVARFHDDQGRQIGLVLTGALLDRRAEFLQELADPQQLAVPA